MLKRLTFIFLSAFAINADAQVIQRLNEGDVIYGKVKQIKETHHWVVKEGSRIPGSTGDTIQVLVYDFNEGGRMTNFKAYYPRLIGKGLKAFQNYQYKYEQDQNGNQIVNGYTDSIVRFSGKLNADGKMTASFYYDTKGKLTYNVIRTFSNNNKEVASSWFKKGKLLHTIKTIYNDEGQIMVTKFYDDKDRPGYEDEFKVAPDPGSNWTKRILDETSGKHRSQHMIEREYVYYQ